MIKKFGLKHCKKCYLFMIIFGFIILISSINDKHFNITSDKLPWQIEISENAQSKVFGITLDQTTMREALTILQTFPEIAAFVHNNGRRNLEAYISSVSLSGLSAKMILEYSVSKEDMDRYIKDSIKKEGTPSGAFKYSLNEQDILEAMQAPVSSISYIPYAQFDDEIILQRFGTAAETITVSDMTSILLYPNLGLSITYNKDQKEVLQYVSPANFERLRQLAQSY
ncbi:MAG: hypothetical protein OEY29_15375 [Gammaproteobacteria bacterium]|nr:hypothetical protein [Gammaproteobacteria bacterium]